MNSNPALFSPQPSVAIVIPVGGNRQNDLDKVRECVFSLLRQDYPGKIEIVLVVDPENQLIHESFFPAAVKIIDFQRDPQRKGRDTSPRTLAGWDATQAEIVSLTGVSMVWPPHLIRRAVDLMRAYQVEAIDGITQHLPQDQSFWAEFQDKSLVSEFPRYQKDFILTAANIGQDRRLPSMTSFFMTRAFFLRIRPYLPIRSDHGWDDYNTIRMMVETAQEKILCTNELVAYRNHRLSLRLSKHFTSGMASMFFYLNHPHNKFAQKRFQQIVLIGGGLVYGGLVGLFGFYQFGAIWGGTLFVTLLLLGILLGVYNAFQSKHWQAFFFPPFTLLQVLTYVMGALYTVFTEFHPEKEFVEYLHQHR